MLKRSQELRMKQLHSIMALCSTSLGILPLKYERSLWMKPRSNDFWETIVLNEFDEARWVESFRMKKKTFFNFCARLRDKLAPKFNALKPRKPVSVEKQVYFIQIGKLL
ncbi:hypothetical protein JTB14_000727 [Gonioctena quinquepunctata]|nr:hypothetical protein JTB14_000727 [Gonioctena quinquepunctata]